MKERFLATAYGHYRLDQWDGTNGAGILPVGDKVLVLVDPAMDKVGSLLITAEIAERQTLASTTGLAVAIGETAFTMDGARLVAWQGRRPEPGDRVYFARYAGQEYTGLDGRLYRLVEDRSIAGIAIAAVEARAGAERNPPAGLAQYVPAEAPSIAASLAKADAAEVPQKRRRA